MIDNTKKLLKLVEHSTSMSEDAKKRLLSSLSSKSTSPKSDLDTMRSEEKQARKKLDRTNNKSLKKLHQEFKSIIFDFEHTVLPTLVKRRSAKSRKKDERLAEDIIQQIQDL
jgi:hypothetical protein